RRAGDERRAVQHALDVGVGRHGGIGQRTLAAARDGEREHVPSIDDEPAAPPAGHVLERDLLDALREAPDAAPRRAGEALVHGHRHLAALEDPATACGRDGGLGHGALFYGASWPGCKAHIPCTLSGRTLYMTRTSPGRRNGYLSWARYFFASASMCASAPFSVVSTTRPRTCT